MNKWNSLEISGFLLCLFSFQIMQSTMKSERLNFKYILNKIRRTKASKYQTWVWSNVKLQTYLEFCRKSIPVFVHLELCSVKFAQSYLIALLTEHIMNILQSKGHILNCKTNDNLFAAFARNYIGSQEDPWTQIDWFQKEAVKTKTNKRLQKWSMFI